MTPTRTAMVLTKVMNSKVMTLLTTRAMWPYDIPIGIAVFVQLAWGLCTARLGSRSRSLACVALSLRPGSWSVASRTGGSGLNRLTNKPATFAQHVYAINSRGCRIGGVS